MPEPPNGPGEYPPIGPPIDGPAIAPPIDGPPIGLPIDGPPIGAGNIVGPCPIDPAPYAGITGLLVASALPQLRQNFMPGGFSPRHTGQMLGNPGAGGGVCAKACALLVNELPQFRQNDDPAGLSWPHIEQRIVS